ncbi:MAG TPA: TonB-dependent receptor, partial [Acidobacteriota bacterium]|nr:TonB-dependent receptor [Acidobacteriota bacterium]
MRTIYIQSLKVLCLLLLLVCLAPICSADENAKTVGEIRVEVSDEAGAPVGGAKVELVGGGQISSSSVTNAKGVALLQKIAAGSYQVIVYKDGFETLAESGVELQGKPLTLQCKLVKSISVAESVDVSAEAAPAVSKGASSTTEIQRSELKNIPSKPATVADALPLVPGVTRSPDGGLSISGAAEHHSAMVVNSVDVTDPATGQFGVTVPVDSVESLNIFKSPYLAEFGRFTSGVVSVETKRGGDKWDFEVNDLFPEFRIRSLHLRGMRSASPRVDLNGPLVAGRLYLSDGFELDINKQPVRSLPFPQNETNKQELNSFTQLDYLISPTNVLTGTFHATDLQQEYVNLGYFNPRPVTPNFHARNYTGTAIDKFFLGTNLLESTLTFQNFSGNVSSQSDSEMNLTPTGNTGSYYSEQQRNDPRFEWREALSLAPITSAGSHDLKFGMALTRTSNQGEFFAQPVNLYDSEGHLLQRIEFVNGKPYDRSDLEIAFYGQDHWTLATNLALDLGLRFERQGITESLRMAPRLGVAWAPLDGKTLLHGGIGIFYDRVPLGVYSFDSYPEEVVTTYNPDGSIADGPREYVNILDNSELKESPFYHQGNASGNFLPYSTAWNFEVEQPVTPFLRVRANYLQSSSNGLITYAHRVVNGLDALVLSGSGKSQRRQVELTARFSWDNTNHLFISYVRSFSRGNLNDFNGYLGNFPSPVVRPDIYGVLPADLPNRFLAWGEVRLPKRMRLAPTVEYRNGFPYSALDAYQSYVGQPNAQRYPNFFSWDTRVSKDVPVNKKYTLRFAITGYNLTNHFNPLEVHSNIDDPRY